MKLLFAHCPFCDARLAGTDFLCPACREKIEDYNKLPKCSLCGQPKGLEPVCLTCKEKKPKTTLVFSCYHYDDVFRDGLLQYKFKHQFHKAKGFSRLLLEKWRKTGLEVDFITAVPISPSTYRKYGYNAPYEIAAAMNRELNLTFLPRLLLKKWFVKRQSSLKGAERVRNVKGNFLFAPWCRKKIKGKRILVIDDVYTTGSTANECARVLKQNGAKSVYFLTVLGNASRL